MFSYVPFYKRKGILLYLLSSQFKCVFPNRYLSHELYFASDHASFCSMCSTAFLVIVDDSALICEACFHGTPFIFIDHAGGFFQYGVEKFYLENFTKHQICDCIKNLSDEMIWKKMSYNGLVASQNPYVRELKIALNFQKNLKIQLKKDFFIKDFYVKNFTKCSMDELMEVFWTRNSCDVISTSINLSEIKLSSFLRFVDNLQNSGKSGSWVVIRENILLGVISLGIDLNFSTATLGYYKMKSCVLCGVGKNLVELSTIIAFQKLGLRKLVAECFAENIKSIKSMEIGGMCLISTRVFNGNEIKRFEISKG